HMLGEDENGTKVEPAYNYCRSLHRLDVRDVHLAEIEAVLQPIWQDKAETARRIRGRIEAGLDLATTHNYPASAKPAPPAGPPALAPAAEGNGSPLRCFAAH